MQFLHERIKQIRGDMSREEFSNIIGISPRALITYEQNERTPKADVICRICAEIKISPEWLLMGSGPMHPKLPSDTADNEKPATRRRFEKTNTLEYINKSKIEPATVAGDAFQSEINALNKELRDLLRENGDLRVDVERKKARITELERELARVLKGDEAPPVAEVG